jgi:hypothetical protein
MDLSGGNEEVLVRPIPLEDANFNEFHGGY